jgi:outer membrane protein OmpA-like peptidoglycan-associated protein
MLLLPARRTLPPLVVPLAGLLLATACADTSGPRNVDPPTPLRDAAGPTRAPGQFSKEGWFGTADGLHARLEITAIERQDARTVLRYTVTSLDDVAKSVPLSMSLLDPVGRRLYRPLSTGGASPGTSAAPGPTSAPNVQLAPRASRDLTANFPPIPATVRQLTVLSQGTAGEFTGIPVTGRGDTPTTTPSPSPSGTASPSPAASPAGAPLDLYSITEGATRDVTFSVSDAEVGLRADALFETDSARLSGQAKGILDRLAQEIRGQGDSTGGPLRITGHTDDSNSDNLELSRQWAEAVEKELQNRLGAVYQYEAQSRGAAEPVAREDDAQSRARNRRVEVAYRLRSQLPAGPTTIPSGSPSDGTSSPSPSTSAGAVFAPAAFRPQDGRTVASRSVQFGRDKRRLDVKPFYRDGAYLVAVFEIVNEGPGTIPPDAVYPHKDYLGGAFTSFSVNVSGGTDVYRAVRIGPPAANSATYVDPGRATFRTAVNEPIRGFVYLPAPPGNPKSVVFNAGQFGRFDNVPVS